MTENVEESDTPLWSYVTKLEKEGRGGNVQWKCNLCGMEKNCSYTRVKAHLLQLKGAGIAACKKVPRPDLANMQKLEAKAEKRIASTLQPKKVSLPPHSSSTGSSSFYVGGLASKKRKGDGSGGTGGSEVPNPIVDRFNVEHREILNSLIARMFISAGLPHNFARNPYYVSAFTYATNHGISLKGYLPPGYNMLRTTLLDREKTNIEKLSEPIKGTWKEKGVSIVSDGWSDFQRRPLINFIAITEGGPMFLKAVDCSGEQKDKYFISNLMKEVILEVGHENVVQVITDNASNCKGARQIIEAQFDNIFWTPCVVHTLNLALKNICAARHIERNEVTYLECSWITDISGDATLIKNFIMSHSMRLAIFNEFVPLKLLSVADTRFASLIVMLKRFKLIKRGLQSMVISDKWALYKEDDVGKARFVKEKLLDDLWWDSIDYILAFTAPIYDMLRNCDTDKPCLHLVYDMWDTMIEKVKTTIYRKEGKKHDESSSFYDVVYAILVDRWNKNNTPLHCLAHALNPRYYSDGWLSEDPSRVAPHRDVEISRERTKCLKKYFTNQEERSRVYHEYADFSSRSGDFSDFDSIRDCYEMDPKSWWVIHGASTPILQSLALKLLVQPTSSSCAERNWSIYSFVTSMKRNKLAPQRAKDLVYVHSNLRLLERKKPEYMQGETKMWDIAGDAFDSFNDVGTLEVANLTLDEPDLEAPIYVENGDEDPVTVRD